MLNSFPLIMSFQSKNCYVYMVSDGKWVSLFVSFSYLKKNNLVIGMESWIIRSAFYNQLTLILHFSVLIVQKFSQVEELSSFLYPFWHDTFLS